MTWCHTSVTYHMMLSQLHGYISYKKDIKGFERMMLYSINNIYIDFKENT